MTSIPALLTRFWSSEGGFLKVVGEAPPTSSVAISTVKAQDALVAPYQITLDADVTDFGVTAGSAGQWDPQYHDIEYIWSVEKVGDASYATSTYTAPTNVPASHRVKGTKYGKRIAHVIGRDDVSAGSSSTFNFVVTAINLATGASATSAAHSITIEHPDDYFSAAETFVVRANAGESVPAGLTSNSIQTTMAGALSAVNSAISGATITKARICLQKGETHSGVWQTGTNSFGTVIMYDTWGSSPNKPVWPNRMEPFRDLNNVATCTTGILYGIKMTGADYWIAPGSDGTSRCFTIDSMDSEGTEDGFGYHVGASTSGQYWAWSNCAADAFTSIGGLGLGGQTIAMIGCRWAHDPEQTSDTQTVSGGWGVRTSAGTDLMYFSQCDGFIRRGWYDNTPPINTTQGHFRLFVQSVGGGSGRYVHVERCTFENGNLSLGGSNNNSTSRNVLLERCLFIAGHDSPQFADFGSAGTARNNVMIVPPTRNAQNNMSNATYNFQKAFNFIYETFSGVDPRSDPVRVYNNTLIYLRNDAAPSMATGASYTITEANNVLHAPFATSPVNAGTFALTELFTPRNKGYNDRFGTPPDPEYRVAADFSTLVGTFTVGEVVRGETSLVEKTLASLGTSGDWGRDGQGMRFEAAAPLFGTFSENPSFERFQANETLRGLTSDATIDVKSSMSDGQLGIDSGWYLVGLIPKTVTPTHYIEYDAETGGFTEGETLTGASATAFICQVWDDGTTGTLWLSDVSGTFADNETITDGSTGSATANGTAVSAGTGAVWVPTAAVTPDTATWATTPYARRDFYGTTSHNSKGAVKV